eukprot:tig00001384_g8560.t1
MMASSERPSKRARAELKDGSPLPAALNAPEETKSALERLPGDLLSRILQLLPLKEAFRARRVSRALRDAVEGTTFDGGQLHALFKPAAITDLKDALNRLQRLIREGRLKGSDLSVSIECSEKLEEPISILGAQPVSLLAALAGRCRSVRVKFNFSNSAERVFRWHVVDAFDALAPGGAPGPLQELDLLSTGDLEPHTVLDLPEDRLAPFSRLRALRLPPTTPLTVRTAAAIAARLPALRCLQACYSAARPEVLRRLGPLCLERLILHTAPLPDLGLAELWDTPLANSLRELRIEGLEGSRSRPQLSASDLRALAGMPQLEAVTGYVEFDWLDSRDLAVLLRAPLLAALQLSVAALDASAALAAALLAGPLPAHLALDLRLSGRAASDLEAIAATAGPLLRVVEVDLPYSSPSERGWPLAPPRHPLRAACLAALLRCARLQRLVIRAEVRSAGDVADLAARLSPLAALPPLPGGFLLEIAAREVQREELAARARAALSSALPAAALELAVRAA